MARYTDIDLDFLPHPVTGDIRKKIDAEAIKRSVKYLVLTKFGERLFHPEIGSSVANLLFEQMHPTTVTVIESSVREVIENFEKRVEIISIDVLPHEADQAYYITVTFYILGGNEPTRLDMVLERTR